MTSPLTVGLIQFASQADSTSNLQHCIDGIRQAAAQKAQLVVLQELHNTPYFCQSEDVRHFEKAESIPGPSCEQLSAVAKELGIVIIGSLFERRAAGLYHNTAVVFDTDGRLAGIYRKMHIPDDPGYYEKFYFAPGDLGFKPIQTKLGKIGVLICWDQWFPEAARLMAMQGADLLVYPAAIGWDPSDTVEEQNRQRDAWIISQRGHAIANGLPVLCCNRIGKEYGPKQTSIQFWGSSFIAGPQGELLAQASTDQKNILVADIDFARSEQIKRTWPFFRDRRIDAYHDLTQLYCNDPFQEK